MGGGSWRGRGEENLKRKENREILRRREEKDIKGGGWGGGAR